MTTALEIRHFHLFAGLGGGAAGFNRGEARTAYRRAASAAHPDRGGTDARMAEVNRAWEQAQEAAR